MQKVNYDRLLKAQIEENKKSGLRPSLLLHACCAPCSSYVLEYLHEHFEITLLYYNPNISLKEEYDLRANELLRLTGAMNEELSADIRAVIAPYSPEKFERIALGREHEAEGGGRCLSCYRLRLEYAAAYAKENGFAFFCTTLSISPHKNAEMLNKIGNELGGKYGIAFLPSDFKKNGGYLRSCELSKKYGLYRQDFCGCTYSQNNKKETL